MAKTVVGLFEGRDAAARAADELQRSGFNQGDISVVQSQGDSSTATSTAADDDNDITAGEGAAIGAGTGAAIGAGAGLLAGMAGLFIPGIGPALGVGPLLGTVIGGAGIGAATGGLSGALVNAGVPEEDARLYQEGVRRGGTLVTVRAEDARAQDAADILDNAGAINIDQRADEYRLSMTTTGTQQPPQTTGMTDAGAGGTGQRQGRQLREGEAIPVVEEQLAVGKRQVQRGGVRVYSHVVERPVEEQVTLHEEHARVERRPVNRPVTDADQAFRENVIEVTETAEQPVVEKRAVVKEEIVVSKDATERTETVRDTVRSTEVDVQHLDDDVRTFAGTSDRYRGADWDAVETQYRQHWESGHPGQTWDNVRDKARDAWERTRSAVRSDR